MDVENVMKTVLKDMEALKNQARAIREQADEVDQFDVANQMEDDIENYNKTIWFIQSMLK